MKIWIIVLTIAFIFLRIVAKFLENYIRNDREERTKYYFLNGATKLGIWYGFLYLLGTLVGFADVILVLITLVNKVM